MVNCPRCGRANPLGSVACQVCGARFHTHPGQTQTSSKCRICGTRFPLLDSRSRARGTCEACQAGYDRAIQIEASREHLARMNRAREVAANHPELRPLIMNALRANDLQRDFNVDAHSYQLICDWERSIVQAKNFESARRHEDAAKTYEALGLWEEAGRARDRKSVRTIKHVNVNLNDLIDKLRSGGLSVPYKCGSCGASIVVDKNASPDGLKFCSYCGSSINTDALLSLLQDALK